MNQASARYEVRSSARSAVTSAWPELPLAAWQETCTTIHLWTQIVGKVRLALAPRLNHWWQATFYVGPRGLSTSAMPVGERSLQIEFDLLAHQLLLSCSDGGRRSIQLSPRTVAAFYGELMEALRSLAVPVEIWPVPVEMAERIPFDQDTRHSAYDPEYVARFHRLLLQADRVFNEFRCRFIGKTSPVHFFWGAFDLAVTRFSGRTAPPHPGSPNVARSVMREAYSHEVSSAGFWPGAGLGEPAFYSYAYPEPPGFADHPAQPVQAYFHPELREFILPYEAVRSAGEPDRALLAFLQSTYEAAAERGRWERAALERP
jgi:hypothetical protein